MGCNPRVFQRMTPMQKREYMRKVTRFYQHQLIAYGIGLMMLGFGGIGLVAYHWLTK